MSTAEIQELLADGELLEINHSNFNNFKQLFTVPDPFLSSPLYKQLANFISNNYVIKNHEGFEQHVKSAILSYLAEHILYHEDNIYASFDAKCIVENGWDDAKLTFDRNKITDYFLMHATSGTPDHTLAIRYD